MPTDVVMPQMGESIFEVTITKWLKKPGDKVQRDEPLFEISTDKVDAEIPAPATGVLQEIKVSEGNTVQVNTVVGVIGAANGASAAASTPATNLTSAPPRLSANSPASTTLISLKSPAPVPEAASPSRTFSISSHTAVPLPSPRPQPPRRVPHPSPVLAWVGLRRPRRPLPFPVTSFLCPKCAKSSLSA